MKIHRDEIYEHCKPIAPKYNFEPKFVLTFACQEAKKDEKNPLLFLADVCRLEQAYYGRYIQAMNFATTTEGLLAMSYGVFQMMGESLRESGYFDKDFSKQAQAYRDSYGNNPMHFAAVPDCLNRYCVDLDAQIESACVWLAGKRKAVGEDPRKIALAWNGGGRPEYADEFFQKFDIVKWAYQ